MSGSWPALVKVALLGTERSGRLPPEGAGSQVGVLIDSVVADPERSTERAVLAAAAAVATANRAGRRPERTEAELPAPAPPVDRPAAGEAATGSLGALLGGTWRQLVPEWLEACGAAGLRVPSVWLPGVLEAATADRSLRPAVIGALGERGRWLAALRPEWSWAVGAAGGEVPADPRSAWAEGTGPERRAILRAVRGQDPELGRTLMESTWKVDRADERAAFVELLTTGLSMADEPFLEERGLADRGRDVRRSAAAVLARLPGSRLAVRMQERAASSVTGVGARALTVQLPDDLPPDWEADGIDRKPRRGIGERAWWLAQVVAGAPLDMWGPAAAAVATIVDAEHGEAVLRGWIAAASRQARADWTSALLAVRPGWLPDEAPAALLQILDPPARASWLAGALDRAPRQGAALLLGLAGGVPRPWPAALVRAVAGRAAAALLGMSPEAHAARPALLLVAERADPATLDRLTADLAQAMQADRRLEAELRRPLAFAQLRKDLLAELR